MKNHKPYMNSKITWQAHTVMKVEYECLRSGFFPNGKMMTAKDIGESEKQILICKQILDEHGIEYHKQFIGQLNLFS